MHSFLEKKSANQLFPANFHKRRNTNNYFHKFFPKILFFFTNLPFKMKKGWKIPNKDSTAVGQAASVAAVALMLNRGQNNHDSTEVETGGSCYHR